MRTIVQVLLLFASPIVVYMAIIGHKLQNWWAIVGFVVFVFAFFWAGKSKGQKEKHLVGKIMLEIMVTGAVSLMIYFFLK